MADKYSDLIGGVNLPIDITPVVNEAAARKARGELDALGKDATIKVDVDAKGLKEAQAQLSQLNKLESENTKLVQSNTNAVRQNTKAIADNNKAANAKTTTHTNNKTTDVNKVARQFGKLKENKQNLEGFISSISNEIAGLTEVFGKLDADWSWEDHMPGSEEGELEDQVKALQKAWHDAGKMLNNLSKNKSVDTSKYRNAVFNYVKSLKEYVWGFNLADYLLQSEWGEEYGGEKLRDDIESEIDSFILKDKSNKATIQTIASKLKTVMKSMDEAIEGKITQKIKNQLNSLAENVDRYVMSIGGDTSGLSPEESKVLSAAQGYISKNKQYITTKNSKVQDDIIKDSYKQFDINNNSELSFITKSIKEAEKELEVINSEINVLSDQFGGIVNGISSLEEAINIAAKNNISSDKTKQLAEKYVEDFTYLRELLTFLDGNAMLPNKPSDYYSPESIKLINASYAEFSSALELFNTLAGNPETEEKKLQAMAVYVTKAYESFKYLADRSDANFYEVFKKFGLSSDAVVYMVDGIPSQITKITKSLRDAKDELYFQFYKDFPQLATDIGSGNLQAYSKKSYDDFIKGERDISEGKYYEILESASNAIDNTINKSEVIESLNDLSRSVSIQQHKISDMGDTASNVANSLSKMMEITDAHNRTEEEKYLVTSSNKKVKQKTLTSRELAGTLFSDGSISYTSSEHNGHADEYEMLVSMFDNLFSDAVMSLHTHPYRRYNDQISESWGFSTSDIIGALGDSKMGNKLTGVLSGKILQVMDVSNFTEDLRLELIEQIKNISKQWFDNNKYPDLFNYTKDEKYGYYSLKNKPKNSNVDYEKQIEKYDEFLQEVLSKVGLQDHIKTYNLSDTQQFNEAVKYISKFAEQSKTDLIDTERFSKLLNSYADIKGYGSDRRKQIDTVIKDYSEGIITAQEGFAKIMGQKLVEMGRIAISQQENKQDEKQNDSLSNSRAITPNKPLYTQTQLEYEQAVLDKIKQLYTDNIQQVSKVWNEVFTYNPPKKQTFTDALSYGDSTVQVGQRGDVRVYNKKLMMVEKDFSNFEDKIKKAVDYLYRVGVNLDSTIAGIYPPGYQEQMKQIEAERKAQEEQTKNKVVKNTLEESTENAINKLKDYEKLYDQVSMKVFHGSKVALDNVDYDPSKTQGQKKLGEGLYTTPDIELAVKHGQNLLEIQTNLNNAFILSEDKITSLTNLYKAMGKELPEVMPKDQFWKKIKSDLMEVTSTPKGAKQFSENMKAMGYQGMYSKGYGYADSNTEQLVIYDEELLKGLSTQSASILAERYPQIKKETKAISENTKAWSENASEISGRKGELQQEIKLTEVQITKLKEEQQELENLVNGISKFLDPNTAAQWINNKITDNDLKKSIKDTAALESKRLNNTAYQAQLSQQYGSAGSSVGTLKAARAWFEATRVYKDGALTKTLDKQFPNALNLYNKSNLQGEIDKVKTVQRAINEKLVALNAKFAKQQQELNDLNRGILKEDTQSNNKQQVVTKEQIKPEQKTTNNIPVQENKTTISEVKKQEAEIKKQEDVVKKVNKQLEVQSKQEQEVSDKSKETTEEKEKQVKLYEEIVQRQQQLQQTDPNKDVVTTPVIPQEVENKKEELEIEQEITKEKEKQRQVTEETVKVHRKVRREPITSSDESSKDTKKKQTKKEIDEVNPAISGLISQTLDDALSTLANAKDNKTTLFDFGKINTQEDLQRVAKDFVNEIANQAHMAVKNVKVDGRQILATLYDEMLKVTVKQTYTLTRGKQDEPPKLRLTGQSYSQNVQAYTNGNAFDVEEGLQKAFDAVEKLKKSVHGLKYDFSDLDASATAVNSLDTWNDFTNKLKEAQEEIQLIKSSISSKGSSNLFATMQKDMQNSDIELKKIQTKLDGFGNIKGIEDANSMLDKMSESVKKFNDALTPEEQVNAYNQYNETNERLKKQIDLLNETERTIKKQQQEQKKQGEANDSTKTITAQYQELYNVIQKISNINNDIMKYQSKNDGSGIFTQLIAGLKSDKASLQNELNSIINTLNQKEVFEFGDKIYAPFESSTLNGSQFEAVVNFINDIGTQAVISEKNIDKLVDSLKSAAEIDVNAKSQLQNLFISYSQMQQKIFQNQGLEDLKGDYKLTLANRSNEIETLFSQIDGDWTSEHVGHLKQLISEYTEYGNTITSIAEKEKQYFEGKQKYKYTYQASDGKEKTGYFTNQDKQANNIKEYLEYQKQLESAAREIAKEQYNIDKVFVTGYSKDKNGIARLDFSGWNEDLKTLQTFRAEMGSVTEGIYVTAQSVNKTFESISNAQKQMGNTSGLLEILKSSGINLDADNATRSVSKLVTILDQLQTAISADVPDSNLINKLTKDLKMSTSEVEAAYKRMSQVQDMIDSGTSKYSSSQISTSTPEAVQNSATQVIREYAAACRDANIENVNFSEGNNKVTFSLITEGGEIRKCTGYIDQLSGKMAIQENSVSKVQKAIYQTTSSYDQFKNVLGKTAKQLMVAFVGYNVFYKVISQIRTGIGYVKEIDLAMTELKKVTDESANSYKNFTNVAYESAGKVGATVSDFINASADFARLGYSINEAGKMAETAIVYKNVADGMDSIEQSTESIISTMKAFGIEAENTMSIADKFNEVGKLIAQVM